MENDWSRCPDETTMLRFLSSGGSILHNGQPGQCPLCNDATIRFYTHIFDASRLRGAIWLWCPRCRVWESSGQIYFTSSFDDPFNDVRPAQFESMERAGWIDRLDRLVAEGKIPQVLKARRRPPMQGRQTGCIATQSQPRDKPGRKRGHNSNQE